MPIRLSANLTGFLKTHDLPALVTGRSALWESAWQMIKSYPVTGVGLGGYIVELPNYLRTLGLPFPSTDSAENYFLQIGSELGLIGLFLVLWLFWEIFKKARETWKIEDTRETVTETVISLAPVTTGVVNKKRLRLS